VSATARSVRSWSFSLRHPPDRRLLLWHGDQFAGLTHLPAERRLAIEIPTSLSLVTFTSAILSRVRSCSASVAGERMVSSAWRHRAGRVTAQVDCVHRDQVVKMAPPRQPSILLTLGI
jgi:hypothetical protein